MTIAAVRQLRCSTTTRVSMATRAVWRLAAVWLLAQYGYSRQLVTHITVPEMTMEHGSSVLAMGDMIATVTIQQTTPSWRVVFTGILMSSRRP